MTTLNFNFDNIRKAIRNGHLQLLGKGSSRKCYSLGNNYIAKVAFTESGIAQNEEEINLSECEEYFNPVIDYSSDFQIVIFRKAKKIRYATLKKLLDNMQIELYSIVNALHDDYSLCSGDLYRDSSWGIVDSKPVLIDYGCTQYVYDTFYKPQNKYWRGSMRSIRPKQTAIAI